MKTAVKIAELKAQLSRYLRTVREGDRVMVLDREQPIATIVPYREDGSFKVRKPSPDAPKLQDLKMPEPLDLDTDVVDLLLRERQVDR